MPLVRNTLKPVPTAREVRVRLVAPVGWYSLAGAPREVVTGWSATVAADGIWSVDVPANADYDAPGTWYLVDEPGGVTHAMVVPQTAGPHELRAITIDMPGGGSGGSVPTASPTTLLQLRDVDATTAALGRVLAQTAVGPARFGFVALAGGGTDHGALGGLDDDDHLQYLTAVRGDARYVQPAALAPVATSGTYASLTGTVPQAALPAIALTEHLGAVVSQAAMLALAGQRGDWCTRTDLGTDWQLIAEPSTLLASWREMSYPASPVSSVNGRTGAVTGLAEASALTGYQPLDSDLTAIAGLAPADGLLLRRVAGAWAAAGLTPADIGLGNVNNTSDLAKPVSTATADALAARQPLDADLTAIAAMAPDDDALIQRKGGVWAARTLAQLKTDLGPDVANALTVGEETFTRERADSSTISTVSGALRLTYFTARKSGISTQVRMISGTTAAGATPTLCRLALYLIDSAGDGTLVASTANDTSLFATTLTAYTRLWTAAYLMVAIQRYALSKLIVSTFGMPTIAGYTMGSAMDAETTISPRLTGRINAQTDLPVFFSAASQTTSISRYYGVVLP